MAEKSSGRRSSRRYVKLVSVLRVYVGVAADFVVRQSSGIDFRSFRFGGAVGRCRHQKRQSQSSTSTSVSPRI